MSYTYKNITNSTQLLTLPSQQRNSVSHIHLAAGSTIELAYPGLDMYLPHILARMEGTANVTHTILRQNEATKAAAQAAAALAPTTPAKPAVTKPNIVAGNPTAVRPGIYIDKTPAATPTVVAETKATATATPAVVAAPTKATAAPAVVTAPVEATTTTQAAVAAPVKAATPAATPASAKDKEALLTELKDVEAKLAKE